MRKLLLVLALVLASTGTAVVAVGADTDENGGRQATGERDSAGREGAEVLSFCDGGAQERELNNIQDAEAGKAEGAATVLPSSQLSLTVPAGDNDTIKITLTGEAAMTGAGAADRIEVQARAGGVPMEPTPGPVGFHSGNDQDSNSAVWCRRFGPGTYAFDIVWNVVDVGANNVVTGRLDDYVITWEILN